MKSMVEKLLFGAFYPYIRTFALREVLVKCHMTLYQLQCDLGHCLGALFSFGGYFFGGLKIVQDNFSFVVMAIIFISVLPAIIEYLRDRSATARKAQIEAK